MNQETSPDIQDLYEQFVAQVKAIVPFDRMAISLVDASREEHHIAYESGDPGPTLPGVVRPLRGSAGEWVLRHQQAHISRNLKGPSQFPSDLALAQKGFRSALRVPLFAEGRPVGMAVLVSRQPAAYGSKEASFIERLASDIAPAIENSELFHVSGSSPWPPPPSAMACV